jgi:hypothetical protein
MSDELSPVVSGGADRFARAYFEWAEASAASVKMDTVGVGLPDEESDAAGDAIVDRLAAAERELAMTPAFLDHQLITKFEIMESLLWTAERDGAPYDKRHLMIVASIKADLENFDLMPKPR